jgi:SNF2 family DNA or RNA helicase
MKNKLKRNPTDSQRKAFLTKLSKSKKPADKKVLKKLTLLKKNGSPTYGRLIDILIKKEETQKLKKKVGETTVRQIVSETAFKAATEGILSREASKDNKKRDSAKVIVSKIKKRVGLSARTELTSRQRKFIIESSEDYKSEKLKLGFIDGKWILTEKVSRSIYKGTYDIQTAITETVGFLRILLGKQGIDTIDRKIFKMYVAKFEENESVMQLLSPYINFYISTLLYAYPALVDRESIQSLHEFFWTRLNNHIEILNKDGWVKGIEIVKPRKTIAAEIIGEYTPPPAARKGLEKKIGACFDNAVTYESYFVEKLEYTEKDLLFKILNTLNTFENVEKIRSIGTPVSKIVVPNSKDLFGEITTLLAVEPDSKSYDDSYLRKMSQQTQYEHSYGMQREESAKMADFGDPDLYTTRVPYVYVRVSGNPQYVTELCELYGQRVSPMEYLRAYLGQHQIRFKSVYLDKRKRESSEKVKGGDYLKIPVYALGLYTCFSSSILGNSERMKDMAHYIPYWTFGNYWLDGKNGIHKFTVDWCKNNSAYRKLLNKYNLELLQNSFTASEDMEEQFTRFYVFPRPTYRPYIYEKVRKEKVSTEKLGISDDPDNWKRNIHLLIEPDYDNGQPHVFLVFDKLEKSKKLLSGIRNTRAESSKNQLIENHTGIGGWSKLQSQYGEDLKNAIVVKVDLKRTLEGDLENTFIQYGMDDVAGLVSKDCIDFYRQKCDVKARDIALVREEMIKGTNARQKEIDSLWREHGSNRKNLNNLDNLFANLFVFLQGRIREKIQIEIENSSTGESETELIFRKIINYLINKKVDPIAVSEGTEGGSESGIFKVDFGVEGGAFKKGFIQRGERNIPVLDVAFAEMFIGIIQDEPEIGEGIIQPTKGNRNKFKDAMIKLGGIDGGRSSYTYTKEKDKVDFQSPYSYLRIKKQKVAAFCRQLDDWSQDRGWKEISSELIILSTAIRLAFILDKDFRDCSYLDAYNDASSISEIDNDELRIKAEEDWDLLQDVLADRFKRTQPLPEKYRSEYDEARKKSQKYKMKHTTENHNDYILGFLESKIKEQNKTFFAVKVTDTLSSNKEYKENEIKFDQIELYTEFPVEPYDYQKVGIAFASNLDFKAIIGDDMGLGKTIQGIGAMALSFAKKLPTFPCMILAPTSVVGNWKKEVTQWLPQFEKEIIIVDGKVRNDPLVHEILKDKKIHISGYEGFNLLLETAEENAELYKLIYGDEKGRGGYKFLIMDEMHRAKNRNAGIGSAVLEIAEQENVKVIGLTGTLLENRIQELYVPFHIFDKARYPDYETFQLAFALGKDQYGTWQSELEPEEQERLAKMSLKCFQIRRFKNQALQGMLPSKSRLRQNIHLGTQEQKNYEQAFSELPFLASETRMKKAFNLFRSIMGNDSTATTGSTLSYLRDGAEGVPAPYPPLTEGQVERLMEGKGAQALTYLLRVIGTNKSVMAIEWLKDFFESQERRMEIDIPPKYTLLILKKFVRGSTSEDETEGTSMEFPYLESFNELITDFGLLRDIVINKEYTQKKITEKERDSEEILKNEEIMDKTRELLKELKQVYNQAMKVVLEGEEGVIDVTDGFLPRIHAQKFIFKQIKALREKYKITPQTVERLFAKKERIKSGTLEKFGIVKSKKLANFSRKENENSELDQKMGTLAQKGIKFWLEYVDDGGFAYIYYGRVIAQRLKQPVVVFVKYLKVFTAIMEGLKEAGISTTFIRGDVPTKERTKRVQDFQDGKYQVFLANQSAREGITLTNASQMLFVELWYVPARIEQAEDRIWRIGQENDVTINYLIVKTQNNEFPSVDEKVYRIIERKRLLINSVMGLEDVGSSDQKEDYKFTDASLTKAVFEELNKDIFEGKLGAGGLAALQERTLNIRDIARFLDTDVQDLIKRGKGKEPDRFDDDLIRSLLFPDPIPVIESSKIAKKVENAEKIYFDILKETLTTLKDELHTLDLEENFGGGKSATLLVNKDEVFVTQQGLNLTDAKWKDIDNPIFVPALTTPKTLVLKGSKKILKKNTFYLFTDYVKKPVAEAYVELLDKQFAPYLELPKKNIYRLLKQIGDYAGNDYPKSQRRPIIQTLQKLMVNTDYQYKRPRLIQKWAGFFTTELTDGDEYTFKGDEFVAFLATDSQDDVDADLYEQINAQYLAILGSTYKPLDLSIANKIVYLYLGGESRKGLRERLTEKFGIGIEDAFFRSNPRQSSALAKSELNMARKVQKMIKESRKLRRSRSNPSALVGKKPIGGYRYGVYVVYAGKRPIGLIKYDSSSTGSPIVLALKKYHTKASPSSPLSVRHQEVSSSDDYALALTQTLKEYKN